MALIKIIISVTSLLLVAVVVISVVIKANNGEDNENQTTTSMKGVTTFCEHTMHKEVCTASVTNTAKNVSATAKDFLISSVNFTIQNSKEMDQLIATNITEDNDKYYHLAMAECQDLLNDGSSQLRVLLAFLDKQELNSLGDHIGDMMNWVSAAYAFQETCYDQIEKPEIKKVMEEGWQNLTRSTDNLVKVIADLPEILKNFNKIPKTNILASNNTDKDNDKGGKGGKKRKLINDEYPSWFSAADRKLLEGDGGSGHQPDVIVSKDGSTGYMNISHALSAYPAEPQARFIIYVKAGVYDDLVRIERRKQNIFIYGDGAGKTIITGNQNYDKMRIPPSLTATFIVRSKGFIAKSMTFRNTGGKDGSRAIALRVQSDESAIFDCSIEGYHDTLNYLALRQFYRNCIISGTADFIFGMGSAVIQNSLIVVRKPADSSQANTIIADGKGKANLTSGLVLQNCKIVPDNDLYPDRFKIKTYLGRPWKPYATTVIMQTEMGDFIRPEGWLPWKEQENHETCSYGEYDNSGPGAGVNARDKSFKNWRVLSRDDAVKYTVGPFLGAENWLNRTGAPYQLGLYEKTQQ